MVLYMVMVAVTIVRKSGFPSGWRSAMVTMSMLLAAWIQFSILFPPSSLSPQGNYD